MNAQTLQAERYAKAVTEAMARMRGWRPSSPEWAREVDRSFRHTYQFEDVYVRGFQTRRDPKDVARDIQNAVWDAAFQEA